jgi:hypothetical protein
MILLTRPTRKRRPPRFRLSLNGLAIQISAFALSFMLVALMVVGSSRAAFEEENETVTERVPVGLAEPTPQPGGYVRGTPAAPAKASAAPAPSPTPTPSATPTPTSESPAPLPEIFLSDDSAGTAMFTDDHGLAPGQPEQRCIRVTLDGSVVGDPVRLYAADVQGALAPYLDLVVEVGPDGGVFGDCSGFAADATLFSGTLADFGAGHGGYDTGLTAWAPLAPGESRSFRFTATVRDVPESEGLAAGFGFTWEARA